MMIRASEPPINRRRRSREFVHIVEFMPFSDSKNGFWLRFTTGPLGPLWVYKYHLGPYFVKGIVRRRMKVKGLRSSQIRAARALLRWSADDLARESALGLNTIKRAELAEDETSLTQANDLAVRRALEAAGVIFIDENGEGPGVRLRKTHQHGKRN